MPDEPRVLSADEIWSPSMRAFGAFWASRRSGRSIPARADFLAEDWASWWTRMLLYRVEAEPAGRVFRMVFQGEEVEYTDGGPRIGRRIEEITPPNLIERTLFAYESVAQSGLPLYSIRIGTWQRQHEIAFERLLLPLGPPGGPVDNILGLLLDHGMTDALRREGLFGKTPGLDRQSFVFCHVDPGSFASIDVARHGNAFGTPLPAR
jgi:hypothetical protein